MMRALSDRELLAHIAQALDAGESRAVEAALAVDPMARRRHDLLAARVNALTTRRDTVVLPRVHLPGRVTAPAVAYANAAMADGGVHPGDRVILRVVPEGSAAEVRPVILDEHGGRAGVLYPLTAEEWVPLAVFPEAAGGGHEVDIVPSDPGEHRYVIVLVQEGTPVDWSLPETARWTSLRDAVEDGTVPAAAMTVNVG